ncbi:MAG TPA: hypothetical protein VJU87_02695 [Gemmatimonadaceae bacterium]|nr:hypothetical protein [Gemmatimonadaceae bacterium]
MMKRVSTAFVAMVLASSPALAQGIDPQCASDGSLQSTSTSDACQKAVDLYQYMAPQLGISLTSGNPMLGQGGTVGGLGHFRVDLRVNALMGSVPKLNDVAPSYSGAQSSAYATSNQVLGLPAANAELGLFRGLPLGITHVGSVDALVSAIYIPNVNASQVSVAANSGSLKFGYGARIGLLEEGLLTPGISATVMKRDLPTTDLAASAPGQAGTTIDMAINNLTEKTTAWRLMASKSLILLNVAAGVGQDKYDSGAEVTASVNGYAPRTVNMKQSLTRTNYFADLSMNFILFKVVGEVGMVQGGKIPTYNTFDKPADNSRLYGSLGLRAGF